MNNKTFLKKIGSIGGSKRSLRKGISSLNNLSKANKKLFIKKEIRILQKQLIDLVALNMTTPYPIGFDNRLVYKKKYHAIRHRIYYLMKKMAGGRHTEEQWQVLVRIVGGICPACGKKKKLTKDHIIPVCWGGNDNIENIQPLCRECNTSKHAAHDRNYLLDKIQLIKKEMQKLNP